MTRFLKAHTDALFQADCNVYHRFIATAPLFTEGHEKHDLNRYWRTQLAALPIDTRQVRVCLDDQLSDQEWIDAFQRHVLPVIVKYQLPIQS